MPDPSQTDHPRGSTTANAPARRHRAPRTSGRGRALALAVRIAAGIVVVAGVVVGLALLVQANRSAQVRAAELRLVRSVTSQLGEGVVALHDENGQWPSSVGAAGGFAHDTTNGVRVTAYRQGDRVCVEGERDGVVGSWSDGSFAAGVCDPDVFGTTLAVAWGNDQLAAQRAAERDAVAVVQARADETAAASSLGAPKDLGLRLVPDVDLVACALIAGNRGRIENDDQWQALVAAFAERAATLAGGGLDNEAYELAHPSSSGADGRAEAMLRADFACWFGGYVGPGPEPVFPTAWTTPLTQAMVDAEQDRVARWPSMTEAERAPYVARMDAEYAQERAEIETIIAERY